MVTADLLSRARAGDGEAFRELTGPHRRELQVHCYRMLGSFADAEDAVQETMLAAWQGIGGFTEERASLRTWLYKIATNRCLNARRAASRRPARERDVSQYSCRAPGHGPMSDQDLRKVISHHLDLWAICRAGRLVSWFSPGPPGPPPRPRTQTGQAARR